MKNFVELFPQAASTIANQVDGVYFLLVAISVFFSALICGLIIFFSARYRAGNNDADRSAIKVPTNIIEAVWIGLPLVIVVAIFVISTRVFTSIQQTPEDTLDIQVIGKQWMWKTQHPNGKREINELHVPLNRPVKLRMISQDVIHSFYVPAFRVKQDVLPGRYTTMWFEANQVGSFHLFCAEYCGTSHSGMIGKVVVMQPEDYESWVSGTPRGMTSITENGEVLFKKYACNTCHAAGPSQLGPTLTGIYGKKVTLANGRTVTADDNYIRESIYYPNRKIVQGYQALMPTFKGQISEDGVMAITAYIQTLKGE